MDVELLVVPDCPNEAPAAALLRTALDDVGLVRVPIKTTVIDTPEQADSRGFIGSPTVLIDGDDPFADPGQPTAVACRIYRNSTGPAGVPRSAAAAPGTQTGRRHRPPRKADFMNASDVIEEGLRVTRMQQYKTGA